jgi:hypothetical protein
MPTSRTAHEVLGLATSATRGSVHQERASREGACDEQVNDHREDKRPIQFLFSIATGEREAPESRGYAQLLIQNGWNPTWARTAAALAVRHGRRRAAEAKRIRPVYAAIRTLAGPVRQMRSLRRCAVIILEASQETSIVENLFASVGLHESAFISLLERVSDGRDVDVPRLQAIAQQLHPHLQEPRGPKISAASAAHEFILLNGPEIAGLRWQENRLPRGGTYVDALTRATQLEFGNENFDSRPVVRRMKRGSSSL